VKLVVAHGFNRGKNKQTVILTVFNGLFVCSYDFSSPSQTPVWEEILSETPPKRF
jgi:hypothetical protein